MPTRAPAAPDWVFPQIPTIEVPRSAIPRIFCEPSRRVELAAIAVAALGLHRAGGDQTVGVARRGSGADYLVDETLDHLEIAGRSRRRDLDAAWQQKQRRLTGRSRPGFYVCVAEFESPAARLAFLT